MNSNHENLGKGTELNYDMRIISPDDNYHYFFGYYDLNAYHENGMLHLANRVSFMDRQPTENDVCELGVINLNTLEFTKFAETTAWNFQQGALMTYNKANYDEVFYNVRVGNEYKTCIHNLKTNIKRYTDRACACISHDGKYGLAINFSRIYDFRPGYGYAGIRDKWFNENYPDDDGIYLVDMLSGKSKLIISLACIMNKFPEIRLNEKFVVNHITFNTDCSRFLFLLRNFASEEGQVRLTSLITSDLEGNMYCLSPSNKMISHYHWKNPSQVVFYCEMNKKWGLYLLDDLSDTYTEYKSEWFDDDIHCIYSPNRKFIIGDGYPHDDSFRRIYFYNVETKQSGILLRDYSINTNDVQIRCDLHNRWNVEGNKISFDTTRNGKRQICEVDVSKLIEKES